MGENVSVKIASCVNKRDKKTYHVPSERKERSQPPRTTSLAGEKYGCYLLGSVRFPPNNKNSEELDEIKDHDPPTATEGVVQEVNHIYADLR